MSEEHLIINILMTNIHQLIHNISGNVLNAGDMDIIRTNVPTESENMLNII